jgi:hypothetical protein
VATAFRARKTRAHSSLVERESVATAFRARKTRARECYKAIRGCFWRWREISQWLKGRGRERKIPGF